MDTVTAQILSRGFGLKLINGQRSRTGFICKTDAGDKELKRARADEKMLIFENAAKEHLIKNGFLSLRPFNKTLDGLPYFSFDGANYTLEDYAPDRPLNFKSLDETTVAAETLALMHISSANFVVLNPPKEAENLIELYTRRKTELMRIKKRISSTVPLSDVDLIVLNNFEHCKNMTDAAIKSLYDAEYNKAAHIARENKTFCHNVFKAENICFDEKNNVIIKGLDGCSFGLCLMDLSEFIRRYIKTQESAPEGVCLMLNAYNKKLPLSPNDIQMIRGMLMFPGKFFKLINQYYNKRRVYTSEAFVQKLKDCVLQQQKTEDFLSFIKI